jgi:hypothetical protein
MFQMDFNPHSLHQILTRIREQMRCPQCGTRVDVDFPSIKLASDEFMLLQLKCESCSAFIVLQVNLTQRSEEKSVVKPQEFLNASSTLSLSDSEMQTLRSALDACDGSFQKLFAGLDKSESHQ